MRGKATVGDLENMSIVDVDIANEALDAWDDAERRAIAAERRKAEAAR